MSRRKYRCLVRVLSDHDTADYCQLRITSIWQMERVACPDIARELSLLGRGIRNVLAMHAVQGGQAWGAYEADALLGILAVSRYQMRDGLELHLWGLHAKALHRDAQAELALLDAALGWCRYQPRATAVRLRLPRDDARIKFWGRQHGFQPVSEPLMSPHLQEMLLKLPPRPTRRAKGDSPRDVALGDRAA